MLLKEQASKILDKIEDIDKEIVDMIKSCHVEFDRCVKLDLADGVWTIVESIDHGKIYCDYIRSPLNVETLEHRSLVQLCEMLDGPYDIRKE